MAKTLIAKLHHNLMEKAKQYHLPDHYKVRLDGDTVYIKNKKTGRLATVNIADYPAVRKALSQLEPLASVKS